MGACKLEARQCRLHATTGMQQGATAFFCISRTRPACTYVKGGVGSQSNVTLHEIFRVVFGNEVHDQGECGIPMYVDFEILHAVLGGCSKYLLFT